MDRYRVLRAIFDTAGGQFTAPEIAQTSGVNLATVRTVLRRDAQFVEVSGEKTSAGPGGRYHLYKLRESHQNSLRALLQDIYGSSLGGEPPRAEAIVYIEPPTSFLTAHAILTSALRSEEAESRRGTLVKRARRSLADARESLADENSTASRQWRPRIDLLEGLCLAFELEIQGVTEPEQLGRLQKLLLEADRGIQPLPSLPAVPPSPAKQEPEAAFAAAASSQATHAFRSRVSASTEADAPNIVIRFHAVRERVAAQFNVQPTERWPKDALIAAASQFQEENPADELVVRQRASELAETIRKHSPAPVTPGQLVVFGREPGAWENGIVGVTPSGTIQVGSLDFCSIVSQRDLPKAPVSAILVHAADRRGR